MVSLSCVGYSNFFGPASSSICLNLTLLTRVWIYLSFETRKSMSKCCGSRLEVAGAGAGAGAGKCRR